MYQKEEFLALSKEFQDEKKRIKRKQNIKMIIGMVFIPVWIVSMAFTIINFFNYIFDKSLLGAILVWGIISVISLIVFIYGAVSNLRLKGLIENLENEHYRIYVAQNKH